MPSVAASTAERLTLSDVLSDLDALGDHSPLLSLAPQSLSGTKGDALNPPSGTGISLLETATGSSASQLSKSDCALISSELRASFAEAQRLNTELVCVKDVGLLLPSERGKLWTRSAANAPKATRTDLLHTKLAALQTQVDAWDQALRSALQQVDTSPSASLSATSNVLPSAISAHSPRTDSAGVIPDKEQLTNPTSANEIASGSEPAMQTHNRPVAESTSASAAPKAEGPIPEFEDDDPWNDLS